MLMPLLPNKLANTRHSATEKPLEVVAGTIFGAPARNWLAGALDDEGAIAAMADSFARLARAWDEAGDTTGRKA